MNAGEIVVGNSSILSGRAVVNRRMQDEFSVPLCKLYKE